MVPSQPDIMIPRNQRDKDLRFDLKVHRDLETFKLGAKRSALHRLSVMFTYVGRRFDVVNLVAHARNKGL